MAAMDPVAPRLELSVIVPARNEQVSLGDCLQSLVAQLSVAYEIIVVDDHSTDSTREIAESFRKENVCIIEAPPLPGGWTGKNNAVTAGARQARGEWLLFTDADTIHIPGSLARALAEAQEHHAELLSYSPEQMAVTFWEMAILPVVFAALARQYPPRVVSDPGSPVAAANGQFLLIRRSAYEAVGGHAAIAAEILEDVALARAVKRSGRKIRFRYAPDAVRTRMYRNYAQLRDGWTKNLALLFPNPSALAAKTFVLWAIPWIARATALPGHRWWGSVVFVLSFLYLGMRIQRSNFTWDRNVLGVFFGMPMFAYLLLRSKRAHRKGTVLWKGRTYSDNPRNETNSEKPRLNKAAALTTGN